MMQEMTREKFYDFAAGEIKNYIPEDFTKIDIIDVNNSRGKYKGLTAKKDTTEKAVATPVVNLDLFYDKYSEGHRIEAIFEEMSKIITMTKAPNANDIASYIFDWEKVKDKLFVTLTNIKKVNTTVYNKVVGDIVMVARILVGDDGKEFSSAVVTEQILAQWQQGKNTVLDYAMENARNIMGLNIFNMCDMFSIEDGPAIKIVSNRSGNFGAAALLYPGVMDQVAKELEGSFYALPSSVHEFICVPKFGPTADELKQMVTNINGTVVEDRDVLSNCVFYYDSENKKFMEV